MYTCVYIYIYIYISLCQQVLKHNKDAQCILRTSCALVHELPQSH